MSATSSRSISISFHGSLASNSASSLQDNTHSTSLGTVQKLSIRYRARVRAPEPMPVLVHERLSAQFLELIHDTPLIAGGSVRNLSSFGDRRISLPLVPCAVPFQR